MKLIRIVVIILFFAPAAMAKPIAVLPKAIDNFLKAYPRPPTSSAVMNDLRGQIPTEAYKFVYGKIASANLVKMPSLSRKNDDSLLIEYDKHFLVLNFLPDHKISLNNKVLDLLAASTMEEQWKMILDALPSYGKAAFWQLLIESAYAEDNAERLTGGAMLGTGGVATATGLGSLAVAGGSTAAITAASIATGVGALVIVASYFVWNNGTCIGIEKEMYSCRHKKDKVDRKLAQDPTRARALKNGQPYSACSSQIPDAELDKDVFETLSDLANNNHELFRHIVTCTSRRRDLNDCIKQLSLDAYYFCINTDGMTDEYLPLFARSSSKGPSKPAGSAK